MLDVPLLLPHAPAALVSEPDPVRLRAEWLVCKEVCIPEGGEFALELPADRCYLIDTDSTVENLARHVAERLAAEQPGSRYRVRAFEGVDKGAIAES